ncbi:MAG: T9SS type A sorting domain-containing protein [Chlorobi bacterium]|nr:T9SS type A sorting domain-containing protein [Chlorobiota bacterium]
MKKLLFPVLLALFANYSIANNGDTITVISHNHTHMNWYGAWDKWAEFPDNSTSYNKVLLHYTLGCPDNGCSDWDYTTMVDILEHTGKMDSSLQSHSAFTVNGNSPDSVFFNNENHWVTFYNENTQTTDSLVADSLIILVYESPVYPLEYSDSLFVFVANYYNYYYNTNGDIIDSVYVSHDSLWYNSSFEYYKPFEIIQQHELGRVITPYGGYYNTSWEINYTFDVTDFAVLLHDSVEIRLFYSGWSDGFEATLKFEIIEGIPPRQVNRVQTLYNRWCPYGLDPDIEYYLPTLKVKIADNTENAKISITATGHGFGGNENCAEFCAKKSFLNVNYQHQFTDLIWKNDCGMNPLFHQAGTWLYDRANWCPGTKATIITHEIMPYINPGDSILIDLSMESFTNNGNSNPGYQIAADLFEFGAPNYSLEASIEEIIAPNNDLRYNRKNTTCSRPIVVFKNNGTDTLKTITFNYFFKEDMQNSYEWNGNLAFLQTDTVILPTPDWPEVNEEIEKFTVNITNINGTTDEVLYNNTLSSTFNMAPVYDNYVVMHLKTNHSANENYYELINAEGEVVHSDSAFEPNTLYIDTLRFPPGCYEFVLYDKGKNGLSFWANSEGTGYCKFYKDGTWNYYEQFNADFGTEIRHQFTYSDEVLVNSNILKPEEKIIIQPNPSQGIFYVEGNVTNIKTIKIFNINGKEIRPLINNKTDEILIDLSKQTDGIYLLNIQTNSGVINKKIIKQ